jgi:hypothetical protein
MLLMSEKSLLVGAGIGVLHHIDHILRYDHSGWPFRPDVTPFTFSLLVYPIVGLIFALRTRPWLRVALMATVLVAVQSAHIVIETPYQQYHTWAAGVSNSPGTIGMPNLLHVQAPLVGVLAAALSILLSVALATTLVLFVRDALRPSRARPAA